jgi:hypothetical protein
VNHLLHLAVWAKAERVNPFDPDLAQDAYGNFIRLSAYGDRTSPFGWEMDHYPVAACHGGRDELSNLRPLHWRRNALNGGLLGMTQNVFSGNALQQRAGGMFGSGRRRT